MKIVVTTPFTEAQKERLKEQMPDAQYCFTVKKEVTADMLRDADILLGNAPAALIKSAGKLRWVQLDSAGYEAYTAPGVLGEDVILCNATGAYGLALSEHMLAQTFFLKKKLGFYHENQMQARWKDEGKVTAIAGSRTLVLGLGNIGGEYARKMAALGSRVTGIRRSKMECPDYMEAVGVFDEIDKYLPEADIVAMALPGTPQTRGIMDRRRFALMKQGSILLNVGRGSAIDQEALYEALQSGKLAGAAVDVTDPEPLPADSPLWQCRNLLITPHIAGEYHMQETLDNIVELLTDNLGRYARGEKLRNRI